MCLLCHCGSFQNSTILLPCFTPLNKTLPLLLNSPLVRAFAYQSVAQPCFAFALPFFSLLFPCVALLRPSTAGRIFSLLVLRSAECCQTLPCFCIALPVAAYPLHFCTSLCLCLAMHTILCHCSVSLLVAFAKPCPTVQLPCPTTQIISFAAHFHPCFAFARRICEWLFPRLTAQCHTFALCSLSTLFCCLLSYKGKHLALNRTVLLQRLFRCILLPEI